MNIYIYIYIERERESAQPLKKLYKEIHSSSVTQLCPTLCDPMYRSTPGLPLHHQLPQFTQTHVHCWWCHPTISSSVIPFSCLQSFPAIKAFQMSQLAKLLESQLQHHSNECFSFNIIPMNVQEWFPLEWTGLELLAVQGTQESSPAPQFKSINSLVLSLLHSPTLTSIHDHRKNQSLD